MDYNFNFLTPGTFEHYSNHYREKYWVEPFLLEIYQLVDEYDHDVKTKFENYLKDMLESLPSHLNEEKVRKELNLVN